MNRVAERTPSNPQPACRVCVIDDCEDFRELLVQLLAGLGWEVSAFESGREALAELGALNPDLILLDIRMPGLDGIQCAERIRTRLPRARIVLMTAGAFIEEQRRGCQAMGRLQICGFFVKTTGLEGLRQAIEVVLCDGIFLSKELRGFFLSVSSVDHEATARARALLTPRELEVTRLLGKGFTYLEIAGHLGISPCTVDTYLTRIREKLDVHNALEIIHELFGGGY